MMRNGESRSLGIAMASLCAVALAAAFVLQQNEVATVDAAPPHILHTAEHPFDPDWLIVRWILRRKCVSCHRADTERNDFTSYEALMKAGHEDDMPCVVPFKTDESMLFDYVSWNVHAEPNSELPDSPMMPEDKKEWLTAGQIDAIKRWIENGALEYRLPPNCAPRPLLETDFPSAKECGACHPRQFEEWSMSMHAYAQHSPIFERFNLTLVERTGGTIGTFCTRCHTPIGTTLGENESTRNVNRSRISREGVTCVVCHRKKNGQYKSNGRINLTPGGVFEGCIYGPFDSDSASLGSHNSKKNTYLKSSQFCGECHDVTSPQGVRLEEAFSEWHNSPAAKAGVTCQSCHMGQTPGRAMPDWQRPLARVAKVPGVKDEKIPLRRISSHIFAGPDYSLLPDTEFPEKLDWMYETDYRRPELLTPYQQRTLRELRLRNRRKLDYATSKRLELLRNSLRLEVHHPVQVAANGKLDIDVDVISTTAGHSVPTGFTAERQFWVSVEVISPSGQSVFRSGDFDSNHDLRDDHSHEVLAGKAHYDPFLLNLQNKFVAIANKGTERSVTLSVNRFVSPLNVVRPATTPAASFGRAPGFRIAKGSLPPLARKRRVYRAPLNGECGAYQVVVRLNFRHLPPGLLDAVGASELKHLLEIVVIDEHQGVVRTPNGF